MISTIYINAWLIFTSGICAVLADECSDVPQKVLRCKQEFDIGSPSLLSPRQLTAECAAAECYLACYEDAVGSCYQEPPYYRYDPAGVKTATRAVCENPTYTARAFSSCLAGKRTDFCFTTFADALSRSLSEALRQPFDFVSDDLELDFTDDLELLSSGVGSGYKPLVTEETKEEHFLRNACKNMADFVNCQVLLVMGKCSQEYADFTRMYLQAQYMPRRCDVRTVLDEKYSYPTNCKVSTSTPSTKMDDVPYFESTLKPTQVDDTLFFESKPDIKIQPAEKDNTLYFESKSNA